MRSSAILVGVLFVTVLVLGFVFQGASALEDLNHEDEVVEKHLRLGKRSASKNTTPNMPDILKRPKALEEK